MESSIASDRTLSTAIELVRELVSKGASEEQLHYEVKTLSKEERQSLLHQASSTNDSTITVSPNDVLAMKSDLSIPWNIFRRYFPHLCFLTTVKCRAGEVCVVVMIAKVSQVTHSCMPYSNQTNTLFLPDESMEHQLEHGE